jgi:hypothetical protein
MTTQTRGKASKARRHDYAWARAQTYAALSVEQKELQKLANKIAYDERKASK